MLRSEQETIIRWDEEGEEATLYTSNPRVAEKWRKLGVEMAVHGRRDGEDTSWQGQWPKRLVGVRPPRVLSPEHKAALLAAGNKFKKRDEDTPSCSSSRGLDSGETT